MKIAILAPIAWRTPPRAYGPWEQVASNIAEGLVARGVEVTLFATADSQTKGDLRSIIQRGYAEDKSQDPKVLEYLHLGFAMQQADEFDLIHNHFDFMPLVYSRLISTPMLTTIHGFSSEQIVPVYQRYNDHTHYASISHSDRHPSLDYIGTVYNGIDTTQFTFQDKPGDYLLYFGRIHPEKGTAESIEIAKRSHRPLRIAGLIQDERYFEEAIAPHIDGHQITYHGNVGPEERDELLGGALALLHPIFFAEPFGLSVAEAMLTGTPVIAFRRGSMPELIAEGKSGYLVDTVAEAVARVAIVAQLDRAACHEYAHQHFSVDRMVDDYLSLYDRILER